MIARDVNIVDINPAHWRNLQSILDFSRMSDLRPIQPKILSVIHKGGKILHLYCPADVKLPELGEITDPQELAKKLYDEMWGLDQIQIYEIQSLGAFSDQVQKMDSGLSLDMDDFFLRAFHVAEQDPAGLTIYPPFSWAWNDIPVEKVREWFAKGPSPCAYFFGVIHDAAPWTSLILRVEAGKVRMIATMEHLAQYGLPAEKFPSRPQDIHVICEAISKHVAPVRAAIICDRYVLAQLLSSNRKIEDLRDAIEGTDPKRTTSITEFGLLSSL
jgi:hypothetical protein